MYCTLEGVSKMHFLLNILETRFFILTRQYCTAVFKALNRAGETNSVIGFSHDVAWNH